VEDKEENITPSVASSETTIEKQRYDVELIFALPKSTVSRDNVFDVSIEGCEQIEHVELKAIDGASTVVQRSIFPGVLVGDSLKIQFNVKAGTSSISGIRLRKIKE
jgi:urease accessory protein UreH